jgi:enamine deaminase RidA (YjgF/YER057c/UK114 family)
MEVEIFLIIPHDSSVTINPVTSSTGEFIGQHLTSPQERGLWITGAGDPASTFSAEVAQCYTETSRLLREYELSTSDIIRTWYFISDIKHNYRPFNVARDHAFKQWNIIHYPASTAIGADFRGERNLFGMFDAYGSLRSSKSLQLLSAASQCDPASYAIKFSRAATVDIGTRRTVYVSGTSCIGPTGQSMTSDPTLNTKAMLDTVLELLARGATNTDDIVSCYAYFTNDTYEKEWIALLQRQGIALNYISHRASVCRPDLPIEIELRAELSLSGSR